MPKRTRCPFLTPAGEPTQKGAKGITMDYRQQKALEDELMTESGRIRTTQDLISLKELVQRWRGATESEIITEAETGRLMALYRKKTVINPDTLKREHWLYPGYLPTYSDFGEECLDLRQGCVFLKNNIIEIERRRPDFLYIREDGEENEKSSQGETENQKTELQILMDRCAEITRLKDTEINRLKQECAEKQTTIQELEAQLAAPRGISHEKRTDAANDARQDKSLAMWKATFPCMVRVYARMEPGRQYTRKEVATLFEAEGVEVRINKEGKPTGAMFGYFWQVFTNSGLPIDDLSNCRWSPDVSAATTTDPLPDDN